MVGPTGDAAVRSGFDAARAIMPIAVAAGGLAHSTNLRHPLYPLRRRKAVIGYASSAGLSSGSLSKPAQSGSAGGLNFPKP